MTDREAKYWALRKWWWIVQHDGKKVLRKMRKDIPELEKFMHYCSYCEIYLKDNCDGCPVLTFDSETAGYYTCMSEMHPYYQWTVSTCVADAKKSAQAVLDLIRAIKVSENLKRMKNASD